MATGGEGREGPDGPKWGRTHAPLATPTPSRQMQRAMVPPSPTAQSGPRHTCAGPPAALAEPGVTTKGVWPCYGTRAALADVSLQVARGEILGLLGPTGASKTTLFHLLATLMPPMEGQVA